MKTVIEIDSEDIKEVFAKIYKIDPNNVEVFAQEKYVGYGPNETMTHVPCVKITIQKSDIFRPKQQGKLPAGYYRLND